MAFEILGDVIAKVSGEWFDDYVQHHILQPLGMKDSTLLVKQADPKLLAWGHELDESGNPFASKVYPYNRMHSPQLQPALKRARHDTPGDRQHESRRVGTASAYSKPRRRT
jgi:CubicO group peptidase (beta-lactamase class C family)